MPDADYKLTNWDDQTTHYIPLSAAEFQDIKAAKANLLEALFIEEKMDIVIENYLELENEILASSVRRMVQPDFSYLSAQSIRNLFSRRIINLLSACRGYLDQASHHINNIYGENSPLAVAFKKSTNDEYDSRLGYRVMEALRNYVQHRGAPVASLSYDHRSVEAPDGRKLRFSTKVLMRVRDLSEDPKFKKSVLDEIKPMGSEFDLQPLVREYVAGLSVVNQTLRDALRLDITNWEKLIDDAIERFRVAFPEQAAGGATIFAMSADEEVWLSKEYIEARRGLAQKNRNLTNLTARYVTSESATI